VRASPEKVQDVLNHPQRDAEWRRRPTKGQVRPTSWGAQQNTRSAEGDEISTFLICSLLGTLDAAPR
jgi:hypothetical protein